MSRESDSNIKLVARLVDRIGPILSGHPPEVQSAALADLTAMWLAGMQDIKNPESSELMALRTQLFSMWTKMVFELVPVNAAIIRERGGK